MPPSRIFWFAASSRGYCWKYFLVALLGLGAFMELIAQLPAESELLKISSPKPNAIKKLALGEVLQVVVRCKNKSENAVVVSPLAYTNGLPTGAQGSSSPSVVEPKVNGTVEVLLRYRVPTVVHEIKIRMTDRVTKQELAVIGVPVHITWGEEQPAPPPAPVTKSTPAPVAKPAAGQPGMLRFELQGYEVSQDAAATLFISQPGELDPKALLTATAALVGARKATIAKLPFIEAASGARATATPVGGYSLEAELTRGGGGYVNAIYALRRASDQSGMANGVLARLGGITFMGSLPGSSADTVVLLFARMSEL